MNNLNSKENGTQPWLRLCIGVVMIFGIMTSTIAQITLNEKNKPLRSILKKIEQTSNYQFFFNESLPGLNQTSTIEVKDASIDAVLQQLLKGSNITFTKDKENKSLYILIEKSAPNATATTKKFQGKVVDEKGEAIIGAHIIVPGGKGTITDMDGTFSIEAATNTTMEVSYVGHVSQMIALAQAQPNLKVVLKENTQNLNEVVVIGYGTVKKKDLTTAVAVVSTEDIDQRPMTSAASALQGRAAGVLVSSPTGKPGETLTVRVRGATSVQAGNDPLYVIDGVPTSNLESLSPNDIETMQVLKDASSAAIYGARAANGVVLITTKRGAEGKTRVAFNSSIGWSQLGKTIDALNLNQYRALMKEIPNTGSIPTTETQNTNWNDEVFKTGQTQNYQLSVSSGNKNLTYFTSGGYTEDKGIINQVSFKRYNFRSNIDNQLYDWLRFGSNVSYSRTEGKNQGIDNKTSSRAGVILSTINTPPYMQIWHPDPDKKGWYDNRTYGAQWVHPIAAIAENNSLNVNNYFIGSAYLEAKVFNLFKLRSSFGYDYKNWIGTSFLDNIATAYGRSLRGNSTDERSAETTMISENILTYDKIVNKHNFSFMAGNSFQNSVSTSSYIRGFDYLPIAGVSTINAANQIDRWATNTSAGQWTLTSFLSRFAYNFDSKYLLTVNFRADGSSKLAPGNQWGYFPSASAAWRISGEPFMKDQTLIDDLKVRAGWGLNGNQNGLSNYAWQEKYRINRVPPTADNPYPGPSLERVSLENRSIKWETTSQSNVGIDLSMFNSRLNVTLDAYYKRTKDLLLSVPIPESNGVSSIETNAGEMENTGFEVNIGTRNLTGAVKWNTDFNLSFNKNKVLKLGLSKVYSFGWIAANEQDAVRMVEGMPLGSFYGYISQGVDPETGDMMYQNLNDNPEITTSDRTFIGNPWPDFIFGMTNTVSYKGFDLSVFFQGSVGNEIFNASRLETEGMYDFRNQSTAVLDRWVRPGQITDMPRANNSQWNNKNSTRFIEDGSYLRLKNLTLAYNFNSKTLSKVGIGKLRPYVTLNNIFTLTNYSGYDPEVNFAGSSIVQGVDYGSYPQSKSFLVGLNLEF